MQRWIGSCLAAALAAVPALAAPAVELDADAATLGREEFLAVVLSANPSLEAARQTLAAAEARSRQAGALMDPRLSAGLAPLSAAGSGGVDVGYEIRIEQMVPYPQRRRLLAAGAKAEAAVALQDFEQLRRRLALRAALLFTAWYRLHRALEVNVEHRLLVSDFLEVATARYAAGLAGPQDPLQAESELAELTHDQVVLEGEREIARAEMNALLHRDPAAPLPPPPAELPAPADAPAVAGLEAQALANRPEILALDATVRARETAAALALLERRPDLGLMAAFNSMQSDSEHRLMVGATLDLPLRKKRIQAAIVEAEARLAAARSERAAAVDEIRRQIAAASVRLRESHHLLEILRGRRLPAARDRVEAAVAGFASGRNDFAALIDAARELRDAELEITDTRADIEDRRAELRLALGQMPIEQRPAPDPASPAREGATP